MPAIGCFPVHSLTAGRCSAKASAKHLLRARFFLFSRAGCVGLGKRTSFLTPTRSVWRFHVPPNLDSQYPRMQKICQEKNARCRSTFSYVSISCGVFSVHKIPLCRFFQPSFAFLFHQFAFTIPN